MRNKFSFSEYQTIIKHLLKNNMLMDFSDVKKHHDKYCVIRHDVEFSVDRALELAIYEAKKLNIKTSYLFQIRNNCYNLISDTNIKKLHKIESMGHKIGLHYHLHAKRDTQHIKDSVSEEAELFEVLTGIKVDRFSYHRPPQEILKQYLEVDNLINCYDKKFFQYYDIPHDNLDIKYLTDSRHDWKHGHPLNGQYKKVQLLTHPYSWTEKGADNFENFQSLLKEKSIELSHSINSETSTFPKDLLNK